MPALALWLRAALTVAFVLSGGYCLRKCIGQPGRAGSINRINDATHVLMSVAMIAMVWSVTAPDLVRIQVAVFGVAATWFALQATGVPLRRTALLLPAGAPDRAAGVDRPAGHDHGTPPRTQCVHHAILLAATVWMLVAGRPSAGGATAAMSMPGMPMPGTNSIVAGLIGGYCLLAGLSWAVMVWWPAAGAPRRRLGAGAAGRPGIVWSHVGMAAAMGVMLVAIG